MDFTTWTETDDSGDLTVASSLITISTMRRDAVSRVHRDFGADYFANFEIQIETQVTAEEITGACGVFAISSAVGSLNDLIVSNSGVVIQWYYNSLFDWRLYLTDYIVGGDPYAYKSWLTTRPGKKYLTLIRSGTSWSLKIYSDSGRTTLEDTLSITGTALSLRYLECAIGRGATGESATISATVGNLGIIIPVDFTDGAGVGDAVAAFNLTDSLSDSAGAGDAVEGYDYKGIIDDAAGMDDGATALIEADGIGIDAAGISDTIAGSNEAQASLADAVGLSDESDGLNWTAWQTLNRYRAIIRYYCTITGANDGRTDIEIPISSFSARKRTGESNYLSVVVPGYACADQISERANGEIVIDMAYMVDGVESLREEIIRVDLEQINPQIGPRSRSITLIGHKSALSYDARSASMQGCNYKYSYDGYLGFRFPQADPYLNPGDALTVVDTDDAITVGSIIYSISARGYKSMEVREG